MRALYVTVHSGHSLARAIEGQLAQAWVIGVQRSLVETTVFGELEQCNLGRVTDGVPLRVALHIIVQHHGACQPGNTLGQLGRKLRVACLTDLHELDVHAILSQRTGFVCADVTDRAERFDGWQPPDQRLPATQLPRAQSERHGDDRRQCLGDCGDGEAHCSQEHEYRRLTAQHAGEEYDRTDRKDGERQTLTEFGQALLQRRLHGFGSA